MLSLDMSDISLDLNMHPPSPTPLAPITIGKYNIVHLELSTLLGFSVFCNTSLAPNKLRPLFALYDYEYVKPYNIPIDQTI